jgi:hypothetical protein
MERRLLNLADRQDSSTRNSTLLQDSCKLSALKVSAVLINTSLRLKLLIIVFNSDGNEAMHHKERKKEES